MEPKPPVNRKFLAVILILLTIVVGGLGYTATKASPIPLPKIITQNQPGLYHVDHAVDGDTLDVSLDGHKDVVRLIGIDTPETHDPRKPVQCYGEIAAAKTRELVEGKNVRLVADPEDSDRDKYKRLLRYVYLPDGTFINMELVRQGYAFAYTVFDNSYLDDFKSAEQEARDGDRGLWSACNIDESKDIKQTAGSR